MEITVSHAEIIDMPAINQLYYQLFKESANLQPNFYRAGHMDWRILEQTIRLSESDVLLAKSDLEIVGFAIVQTHQTSNLEFVVPHQYVLLTDIIVRNQFRGQGIGALLIKAAAAWGQSRGLDYIELNVLEGNNQAVALYQKAGFGFAAHTMRMPLGNMLRQ